MPAGASALVTLKVPRVALYKPWTGSMDEGWTRWLFEQYEIPFTNLLDADVKAGNLQSRFDVIVIPAIRGNSIIEGNRAGSTDPQYVGGIGLGRVTKLREFADGGGTLVALGESSLFAIDQFGLPVRNALAGVKAGGLLLPRLDPADLRGRYSSRLATGCRPTSIAFFQSNPAFEVLAAFGPRSRGSSSSTRLLIFS